MTLQKAYHILNRYGLCNTKSQFSIEWLGASKSYLTSMEARQRQPNLLVLTGLAARLELLADRVAADPRYDEQARMLARLVDDLWDELRSRALSSTPKCRPSRNAGECVPVRRRAAATAVATHSLHPLG